VKIKKFFIEENDAQSTELNRVKQDELLRQPKQKLLSKIDMTYKKRTN